MNLRSLFFACPWRALASRAGASIAVVLVLALFVGIGAAHATDSLEPNDSAGSARRLTSGGTLNSYLSTATDEDWFIFACGQSGNVNAQLSSVPGDADYILSIWSYDEFGQPQLLADADAAGNGGSEGITGDVGPGVYYVQVSSFSGFNPNDGYQLAVTFPGGWPGSGQDGNEPNDDPLQASSLTSQQAKTGLISQPGDLDFFSVTLGQAGPLTLDLTSIPPASDYDLRLYAATASGYVQLAESVNEAGLAEQIQVESAPAGMYFVLVLGFAGNYDTADSYSLVANFAGGGGNQPPTITLSSPNGGESWQVGSQHAITWTASDPNAGDPLSISLEYSITGGAQWTAITSGLSNSGSFNWTVPNNPSTQARVRATVSDGQTQAQDQSNANFSITALPAGQNTLAVGTGSGQSGTQVTVPLTLDNDDVVKGLQTDITFDPAIVTYASGQATSRGATMSYSAAVVGTNKLRVILFYQTNDVLAAGQGTVANLTFNLIGAGSTQSALSPASTVLSDANGAALSVTNQAGSISVTGGGGGASPVVNLTTPNGSESWQAGTVHNITYTATDTDTPSNQLTILYEYSTNGGTSWTQISNAQPNSGSFAWTVPNTPSTQCKARVTASDGTHTGNDLSAANFTITAAPAGSNVLAVGTGNGTSGGEVTVPITLDNDDVIKALQTDLHFDSSILSYESVDVSTHAPGMQLGVELKNASTLRLVFHYDDATTIPVGQGAIANVTFSLLAGGTSAITPQASILANPSGASVAVTEQAGSVTVTGGTSQPPSITLLAPNGGETLSVGAGASINWTATDPDTPANDLRVTIEYSTTGPSGTFIPISSNEVNDGAFPWTVPNTPASTCRVRVTVTDGALSANDLSNSNFTIQGVGTSSNTLSLGTATGESGAQASVTLGLDNDDTVKALQFDVTFDSQVLSFASVAATGRGAALNAASEPQGAGVVRVVLDLRDTSTIAPGQGTIANLTFNCVGASGTNSALTLSNIVISDPAAEPLESDGLNGSIAVEGGGGNGPTLNLFALKNPGRSRILQVFLRSDQVLTQDPTVTAGGTQITMTKVDQAENLYAGSIAIAGGTGSVTLNASAQSAGGSGQKSLTVNF